MYRQGDVLLVPIEEMPKDSKAQEGDIILAYGEATGHSHRVVGLGATLYATPEGKRTLTCENAVFVKHEEHPEVKLPPGKYEVVQQREGTDGDDRAVYD